MFLTAGIAAQAESAESAWVIVVPGAAVIARMTSGYDVRIASSESFV